MKTFLIEFYKKLEKIDSYLNYLEFEQNFSLKECVHGETACNLYETQRKIKSIDKKIIDYNALIISLYGAYENFIELILKHYLALLNEIVPSYDNLPEKLREIHIKNSVILMQEIDKDKRKYSTLDKKDIIDNLYNCINNKSEYLINDDAILMHNSNMWPDTVNELLKNVGIGDFYSRLINLDIFRNFYKDKYRLTDDVTANKMLNSRGMDDVLRPIKELIEERNRVAHSWVENIDINLIKDSFIEYIKVMCQSIYIILQDEFERYEKEYNSFELLPREILRHKFLIFKLNDRNLKVGDKIIIEKGNNDMEISNIESIMLENENILQSEYGQEIGVKLEYKGKLKDSFKYYGVYSF
ncbi:hypothetical protein FDA27_03080 [Clostridium botulinum]|nr:hypothetical protein [Clostridium botulinum]